MVIKMTTLLATIIGLVIAAAIVAGRKEVSARNEKAEVLNYLLWEVEAALTGDMPVWAIESIWGEVVDYCDFSEEDAGLLASFKTEGDYHGIMIVCRQIVSHNFFC